MKVMNDQELQNLLKSWETPAPSPALKERVLERYRKRQKWNWRWLFSGSLRVPIPVASLAVIIMAGLAVAAFIQKTPLLPAPPSPPRIIARIVEVPVVQERVVTRTVYRDRAISSIANSINLREFQPVASLVPRIIKRGQNVN
jgi:hypothetical protein